LTNKILIDPNHQRFFKQDDLMDLFSYNDDDKNVEHTKSMTGKILKNMNMDVEINKDDIAQMEEDLIKKEEQNNDDNQPESELMNIESSPIKSIKEEISQDKESFVSQNITNMPLTSEPLSNINDGESSTKEDTLSPLESGEKKEKKKKKRYSCDSVDNNIKQSKYGQVSHRFLDDDHKNLIKKEIGNIEGIEYSEDFKAPSKEEEEEDDIENDLFTQSEDEGYDEEPKRKKSKKGKETVENDNYSDDIDDIEFENGHKDKSKEYQSKDELRVLKNLMKITGAVSVIEHDKIMDSKKWSDIRDDKEAEKIANSAVKKLRKFMERRRHVDISIPTWTGRYVCLFFKKKKK